ncbi:hypothetical protein [Helicobacter sp. T3_23-1059]
MAKYRVTRTFTCTKCKKQYQSTQIEANDEGTILQPASLVCPHCKWDNQQNYDYFLKQTELDSLLQAKQEQEKDRQEALKQAQLAKRQAELARLLAQCSTPPQAQI